MSIIAILAMVGISIAGKVIYDRFNERVFKKHMDYVDSRGGEHRFYAVEYVDAARLGCVELTALTALLISKFTEMSVIKCIGLGVIIGIVLWEITALLRRFIGPDDFETATIDELRYYGCTSHEFFALVNGILTAVIIYKLGLFC